MNILANSAARWIAFPAVVVLTSILAQAVESPQQVAAKADKILRSEVPFANAAKAAPARIDDERFLRRASLDIIGRLPTPEEVTAFALDPAADKRAKLVEKLLASPQFGENWGRYWRDVIMYRKTEERAQIVSRAAGELPAESFNANKPWSQIATDVHHGQRRRPRERRLRPDHGPAGAARGSDRGRGQPHLSGRADSVCPVPRSSDRSLEAGAVSSSWRRSFRAWRAGIQLSAWIARTISVVGQRQLAGGQFRGPMSDAPQRHARALHAGPQEPAVAGHADEPVLFATGEKLPVGTQDADRRGTLAKWITAKDNPYFAKAFVNRMWAELTGEGFYEPVDDMGPDRTCTAPQTLDYLAGEFAASGYDVKWLFRTIMATELYQLPSAAAAGRKSRRCSTTSPSGCGPISCSTTCCVVLEASEPQPVCAGGPAADCTAAGAVRGSSSPRPLATTPASGATKSPSSIPQALAMMNSPMIGQALRGSGRTMLARLLGEIKDDKALVAGAVPAASSAASRARASWRPCLLYVKTSRQPDRGVRGHPVGAREFAGVFASHDVGKLVTSVKSLGHAVPKLVRDRSELRLRPTSLDRELQPCRHDSSTSNPTSRSAAGRFAGAIF